MILKDKVIVVTGASRGFGKALARALKQENAQVIISSRDKADLEKTAQELSVDYCVADVTSLDDMKVLGKYVMTQYEKIDCWINNAGIQIAPSFTEEIDHNKVRHLFDINFFGYFYGCQVALSYFKAQKSREGMLVNINSTAGLEGKPGISAYAASKFAIKGLTESIRKEVKDSSIQVFGIFPGGMQTDIYKDKYPDDIKDYMEVDDVVKKVIANFKSDNPEIDLIIKRPSK